MYLLNSNPNTLFMEVTNIRYINEHDTCLIELSGSADIPVLTRHLSQALSRNILPSTCRNFLFHDDGITPAEASLNAEDLVELAETHHDLFKGAKIAFCFYDLRSHAKINAIRTKHNLSEKRCFMNIDEALNWLKNTI